MLLSRFKNATLLMHLYHTISKGFFWGVFLGVPSSQDTSNFNAFVIQNIIHSSTRPITIPKPPSQIHKSITGPEHPRTPAPEPVTGIILDMGGNCCHYLGKILNR
jgi:hypothetical protein